VRRSGPHSMLTASRWPGPRHPAGRPHRRHGSSRGLEEGQRRDLEAVIREGWNETAGAFTQYFGSDALDASNLMLPIVGFLPADDPRMPSTIRPSRSGSPTSAALSTATAPRKASDGLAGDEGTFLLCTFWLAEALALAGQVDRPRAVFERAAAYVNDVGLLAEEIDPDTGELLGNFPQAFSHIGLVNAAWAIAQAELRTESSR
jgi:alpha,alpha-trehalase